MSCRFSRCLILIVLLPLELMAQAGVIRGNVFDGENGEPVAFATVQLSNGQGGQTDEKGFFLFSGLAAGTYRLTVSFIGYQPTERDLFLEEGQILYQTVLLAPDAIDLQAVDISARRQRRESEVRLSVLEVSAAEIRSLPSVGGDADIAQYLPVLPGIVSTGDQGGQLYIRGGSPVQNKVLLDGLLLFNPFHSIGLYSVFETETLQSVDVYTGGFNAEFGGRASAVVDIRTRPGNRKRFSGLAAANPFQGRLMLEGPIKALDEDQGNSISFLLTAKQGWLDQTSPQLYGYAVDTTFFGFARGDSALLDPATLGLPYAYQDLFGKLSFQGKGGSSMDLLGFRFSDGFRFPGLADLSWDALGGGMNFRLLPPGSPTIIDGALGYSNYQLELEEQDDRTRRSGLNVLTAQLNFAAFGPNSELNYGFEFTGFNTDFSFVNLFGVEVDQRDFTTELAGYLKYRQQLDRLIVEPGLRLHFYASQAKLRVEPRLGLKYALTDRIRLKAGAGLYSQNVVSTVNDLDIVNFFVGFLAGPESTLFEPGTTTATRNRLQTAWHVVGGLEFDLSDRLEVNLEPYWKAFPQLININRNKRSARDPDFVTETGSAYGVDLSARYQAPQWYLWAAYSLAFANRDNGMQEYPTVFDRRHNLNVLLSYRFGPEGQWETGVRWNLGSPFPFTQTRGFYQDVDFSNLLSTDVLTGNFPIGVLLSDRINGGRMSYYHRLDASLKRTFALSAHASLEVNFSVTNVYDRENVFYVDRFTNRRVNQFPILPALGITGRF